MPGIGVPISAPVDLPVLDPDHVIVMNPASTGEIRAALHRWGVAAEVRLLGEPAAPTPVDREQRVGA